MTDLVWTVLVSVLSGSGLLALIVYILHSLLEKSLQAKIDTVKEKELSEFKHKLENELQTSIHNLQLEHTKTVYNYEYQIKAYSNILIGISSAINALVQSWEDEWEPVSEKHYSSFYKSIESDILFLDGNAFFAVNFFKITLGATKINYSAPDSTSDKELREAFWILEYINRQLSEYFRYLIGVSDQSMSVFPVFILSAGLLLNSNIENDKKWIIKRYESPTGYVNRIQWLIDELLDDLDSLKVEWISDPDDDFAEQIYEVEKHIKLIRDNMSAYKKSIKR